MQSISSSILVVTAGSKTRRIINLPGGSIAAPRRHLRLASVLAFIALSIVFLLHFDPASSSIYPPCPFHVLTGYYCPGCGSLRALHQLLHCDVVRAFGLNPLMVLSLPFLGYAFVWHGVLGRKRPPLPAGFASAYWIWVLLICILGFWILRNIPVYPFNLLAP